jgi:hypothetical protein
MDLQSTAQLLGNLGEFIAALAVVATLIYLAAQVKQGKVALDANTEAMEREYQLRAEEALKEISESTAQMRRPMIQDAELAQLWLDGLSGKRLSEIDEFRFGSMAHESIWQSATMHGRILALGRADLSSSFVQSVTSQIRGSPGYAEHWDLNRPNLIGWGFGDLVQSVEVARATDETAGKSKPYL